MLQKSISYSEKAFAYKLKNDVLKRKSGRKKSQVDHKTPRKRAIEIISEDCGDSPKQVQRYISLTKRIPEMLQKLDDEIISFCPAVEIAALNETEQKELLVAMEYAQAIPSRSQAQRIRQLSKEKQLWLEKMEEIMCKVISVVNQKGGIGKTTTTVNVGIGLAREGKKSVADRRGSTGKFNRKSWIWGTGWSSQHTGNDHDGCYLGSKGKVPFWALFCVIPQKMGIIKI